MGVKPIQAVISERINKKILNEEFFPYARLNFVFNAIDYLDLRDEVEIEEKDLKAGVRTINQVRASRGMEPCDWGDRPLIPFSDASLAQLPKDNPDKKDKKTRKDRKKDVWFSCS